MLNLRQQWNAMSTTTKIALVGGVHGPGRVVLTIIDKV
jgi:L-lactate utilization protein LutC